MEDQHNSARGFSSETDANRLVPLWEFLIYFGACHLKLPFNRGKGVAHFCYREPRILSNETASPEQGLGRHRKPELPCSLHPAVGGSLYRPSVFLCSKELEQVYPNSPVQFPVHKPWGYVGMQAKLAQSTGASQQEG